MNRLIISVIFLIVAVLVFSLWTLPVFREVKVLTQEKNKFEETLSASLELQDTRDDLLNKYNNIASDLDQLNKLLPASADNGGLIVEFDNLTKAYGLTLKNLSITENQESENRTPFFAQERTKKGYKNVGIDFKVSGSYESLIAFIKSLEASLRVMDINSISFLASKSGVYEFNVKANAYMFPEDESDGQKKDLLDLLTLLKKIDIDEAFFQNPVFTSLQDFSSELLIANIKTGRSNPFSPI
jgi:Tfp pilus assembly protein PilO